MTVAELKEQLQGLDESLLITIDLGDQRMPTAVVPVSDRILLMTAGQLSIDQRDIDCDCLVLRRSYWPDEEVK